MEVAPEVFLVLGCIGNPYLIIEASGITLVDTGLKGCSRRILKELKKLNQSPHSIRRIIITHSDGDHYGSLHELQAITDAKTYASEIEALAIRSGRASRSKRKSWILSIILKLASWLFKVTPARVDTILKPGDELPVLGGLTVLDTAGHTPGHISLYSLNTGILFSGDSLVINSRRIIPSKGTNPQEDEAAHLSFQKQADLHPRFILGGHSWSIGNDRLWRKIGESD